MAKVIKYLAVFALLSGCTSISEPFAPPQSVDTKADIRALEEQFGTADAISNYYAGARTEARRNEFVTGRMALINLHYILFIREFSADKAQISTAFDMLQLGTDLAITVVGGASVKAALGAASAGITGTRTSINKNFFYEQTVPALITAMNAERKKALIPIFEGLNAPIDDYPFAQAVTDLEAYYFAGTFIGGLQAIQKDAGAKEAKADGTIIVIKRNIALAKKEARDRVDALLGKVDALSGAQAIALATTPPIAGDEAIETGLLGIDPQGLRKTNAAAAKQALKFMVSLTALDDLPKWEAVLR